MQPFIDFISKDINGVRCAILAVFGRNAKGELACVERLGIFKTNPDESLNSPVTYHAIYREGYCNFDRVHMLVSSNRVAASSATKHHIALAEMVDPHASFEGDNMAEYIEKITADPDEHNLKIYIPNHLSGWAAEPILVAAGELMEAMGYTYHTEDEELHQEVYSRR